MEPNIQNQQAEQQTQTVQTIEQTSLPSPKKINKFVLIAIVIVVLVTVGAGSYYLGSRNQSSQTNSLSATLTPAPTITQTPIKLTATPTSSFNGTADWKTFAGSRFIIKYPNNWFVNEYKDSSENAVEVSDLKNSITEIKGISEINTRISIAYYVEKIPTSFPYTNGSTENPTIKPFSINGYSGIRGQTAGVTGLNDVVLLENPNEGHIQVTLIPPQKNPMNSQEIFNNLLSTFKFTDKKITLSNDELLNEAIKVCQNYKLAQNCINPAIEGQKNEYALIRIKDIRILMKKVKNVWQFSIASSAIENPNFCSTATDSLDLIIYCKN